MICALNDAYMYIYKVNKDYYYYYKLTMGSKYNTYELFFIF